LYRALVSAEGEEWSRTEVFVRLLREVNAVLIKHDPMGIAEGGARPLAYDLEAAQIARLTMQTARGPDDLRQLVDRVFAAYFWPGAADRLEQVAEGVWTMYRELLARRAVKHPSRRDLDAAAIDFARSRLWLAGAFEPLIDAELRGGEWRAWTWADRDVSPVRLAHFGEGGHVFTGSSVEEQIGRIVRGRVRRPPGAWLVIDPLAKPGDASLEQLPHRTFGETVVYIEGTDDVAQHRDTWTYAASAAGTIGLVSSAAIDALDDDSHSLNRIVAAAHFLVLEAYDGDGVIYLERDRAVHSPQP
jgi:hypothetical protein